MRERYLLRADRHAYDYQEILELTPGSARLIVPDRRRRWVWRLATGAFAVAFAFIPGILISVYGVRLLGLSEGWLGYWGGVVYLVSSWVPFFVFIVWADYYALTYLAKHPVQVFPLEILGVQSFGYMQELQAQSNGQPLRITVNGRRKALAEALRLVRERASTRAA